MPTSPGQDPAAVRLAPGTCLGPYQLLGRLGSGGMGDVYRARDERLGRDVAVKVLLPASAVDPGRVRRFEQEARAVGALNHPSLLAVFDVGHDNVVGPHLVFELLEGETLRRRLDSGAFALRKAVDYAIQIAQGLAAAHDKGIAHRDLKPGSGRLTAATSRSSDLSPMATRSGSDGCCWSSGYPPAPARPAPKRVARKLSGQRWTAS